MDITWQQCLGTDESDYPMAVAKANNGVLVSVLVPKGGVEISNYHGLGDAWLVNLDTLGNVIWEKCYGGSGGESFSKIINLPNNEYFLLGGTNSSDGDAQSWNHDSFDIWVVKIDSAKEIIWERCVGGPSHDSPNDAIATPDGGILVLGQITYPGGDIGQHYGGTDAWLCRLDSSGNILWEHTYGGPGDERLMKVIPTSRDTYMMVGDFYTSEGLIDCQKDSSAIEKDVWVVEIDTLGNLLQQYCYGGSYWDEGFDIIEVGSGFVFLAQTDSDDQDVSGLHGSVNSSYNSDIWVVQIDSIGNIKWQNCLGGSRIDSPVSIYHFSDGDYLLFGVSYSDDGDVSGDHFDLGNPDIWVAKLDSLGQLQWQQCIGGISYEWLAPHSICQISDDHYAMAAQTFMLSEDVQCDLNPTNSTYDAWVFEIKNCSNYQPVTPQGPTGPDTLCHTTDTTSVYTLAPAAGAWGYIWQLQPEEAGTLVQDSLSATITWNTGYQGEVQISTASYNDCGQSAYSEAKTTFVYTCVGVEENAANGLGLRVYPNPANELVLFETLGNKLTTVTIYSHTGQLVEKLVLNAARTQWNIGSLPRGLYFYHAEQDGKMVAGKLVLGGE
ncbi:MAG: T9SS type A sorting domain-containing protein [Bacteroidales bacterium]|nr:T9SS type A sorting domain-containing protein [Bacteroidales bacterium]